MSRRHWILANTWRHGGRGGRGQFVVKGDEPAYSVCVGCDQKHAGRYARHQPPGRVKHSDRRGPLVFNT